MLSKKFCTGIFGALLILLSFNFSFASSPYLIEIQLKTPEDYKIATDLGMKAYVKLDNAYITEIDKDKIERLELNNLTFQILDESPWTQDYFLVSKAKFRTKVNLSAYGEVLLEENNIAFLKTDRDEALELLKAGYQLSRVSREQVIPLKYMPLPSPAVPHISYSQDMDSLVNQVSADSLRDYLLKLEAYLTRFIYSDSIKKARQWLKHKFGEFGIDSVYLYPFTSFDYYIKGDWFDDSNVVAVIPGTVNPDKVIVVGGHYDSVNWDESPNNPNAPAPGADDNASGTVATLEIARILADHPLPKTVIFMPFAAEELGLHGSWAYAQDAAYQGMDIQLMFNFDMIAYEENEKDVIVHKDNPSLPYALVMQGLAGIYTDLNVHLAGNSPNSDSWPFSQVGYNILYSAEYIFNSPHYHQASDSVTYLDINYMSKIVKMNLATIIEVASSPGAVKDLQVWDAGDGEKLYVNWSDLEENDIVEYRIYYGTQSGVYTDTSMVPAGITSDTLRGLQNEVLYYIAVSGVNSLGKESIYRSEVVGTPRVIPLAPSGLAAQSGYFKISLSWQPNLEADLSHYNLYRSAISGSGYDSIATGLTGLSYVDSTVQGGIWYYYVLTAVDTMGNVSGYSDEVSMIAITLDQGILVIDESANSRGNPPAWSSDAQQDSFYSELFSDYRTAFYEYSWEISKPSITDLGPYSTVIWLDDDCLKSIFVDNKDYELIKEYIGYGGRFIMFSWAGLRSFRSLPYNFYPGSFVYDYLKISWAREDSLSDFAGAFADDTASYPDLRTDTLKYISDWQGRLRYANILNIRSVAEPLYYFDSDTNDAGFEDRICGLKYEGQDYKTAFFGFPLYYLEKEGAKGLVASLMRDFGEPLGVEEEPSGILPERYVLSQNYPNPFNPATTIPFRVNGSRFMVHSPVHTTLVIYNILGQKVRILVDEERLPGEYKVIWDGRDERGKEVASGIYFYQLKIKDYSETKKMVLLR